MTPDALEFCFELLAEKIDEVLRQIQPPNLPCMEIGSGHQHSKNLFSLTLWRRRLVASSSSVVVCAPLIFASWGALGLWVAWWSAGWFFVCHFDSLVL
ncbi:hypothetical protein XavaCFBP5823_21680 [Xanthomonas axonopodis pv. vasculorum]|nr:hypothetical protein XavaCFBP5823_21680 [Xanthomonas axonopodis pv. vasculorum]